MKFIIKYFFFILLIFLMFSVTHLYSSEFDSKGKFHISRLDYNICLTLYNNNFHIFNYSKSLFYARLSFANAVSLAQRARSLLLISDVYVAVGNYKKANLIYRQIIQNYYNQRPFFIEAKRRLLSL